MVVANDTCSTESGTYTSAALRGIFGGIAYKFGVEYHLTTSLANLMTKLESTSHGPPPEALRAQCDAFKKALHERSPDMATFSPGTHRM